MSSKVRTLAAGGLTAMLALAGTTVPAPAHADPAGYQVVHEDHTVGPWGFVYEGVPCPTGKVALGGGAKVIRAGSANFQTVIRDSGPGTVGDGLSTWVTSVNNGSPATRTIRFSTVCADPPDGYQLLTTEDHLSPGEFLRVTKSCSTDRRVLGGGVLAVNYISLNSMTNVRESAPAPTPYWPPWRAWTVAISSGSDVTNKLYIRRICAYPPVGREVVSTYHTVPSGGFVRTTAICPSGKVVLGGGAMVNSLSTENFGTLIRESGPATVGGRSAWLAAVSNPSPQTRTIRISAVCVL